MPFGCRTGQQEIIIYVAGYNICAYVHSPADACEWVLQDPKRMNVNTS